MLGEDSWTAGAKGENVSRKLAASLMTTAMSSAEKVTLIVQCLAAEEKGERESAV